MDTSRPASGAQVAGISGLALLLIMFLFAWFGAGDGGASIGFDAFDALDDWANLILVFAAFAGISLVLVAGGGAPNLPVALSAIATGLGAAAVIVALIYLISPPSFGLEGFGEVDLDRKLGIWLGLIASLGVTAGGWMAMQEEGTSLGAEADRFQARGGGDEPPPPPPPPPAEPPPGGPPTA
jgi:hypothetical protein